MCISVVTLSFSSTTYEGYEHDGLLCVTLTLDKPALSDTNVEIIESSYTATSKFSKSYIRYHFIYNACFYIMVETGSASLIQMIIQVRPWSDPV